MNGSIYLIDGEGKLVEMNEHAYASEDLLQKLLEDHPNLLAGEQMNSAEPRRWLLVDREMPVPAGEDSSRPGFLDHLFLDQDAIPTLVEVKRSSDTRIRREVVGQMLDYAANAVVHWPAEWVRGRFEARCQKVGADPAQVLTDFLGAEAEVDAFWQQMQSNLQNGTIRMVFVADVIPTELRRIVEFLNEQMERAEVLAVEIRQYVGAGLKTLVPRVLGQTARAQGTKTTITRVTRRWDEPSFFQELTTKRGADESAVARRVFEWVKGSSLAYTWGKGQLDGSLLPYLEHGGAKYWPFAVLTTGSIEVQFQWLKYRAPFDSDEMRMELRRRLNAIPGVSIPENGITRRPSIRLSELAAQNGTEAMLETFAWVIDQIRTA